MIDICNVLNGIDTTYSTTNMAVRRREQKSYSGQKMIKMIFPTVLSAQTKRHLKS